MATVREDQKPAPVYLASVQEPMEQMSGSVMPQRVMSMLQDTAVICVDSSLRKTGNDYNFIADFLQSNASFRQIQLKRCMLPIIPQINSANNVLIVRLSGYGQLTVNLPNGYYTPERFANMLNEEMGLVWSAQGETIQVVYLPLTREITLRESSVAFGILETCSYARFGKNVANFPTIDSIALLTETEITSTSMSMVFTRYVQIDSCELVRNQRGTSLIAGRGAISVIGYVDLIGSYNVEQWSPSQYLFPGTSASFEVTTAPRMNMRDSGSTPRVCDFILKDEFGFDLSRVGEAIQYPVTLWFEVLL
jgi:hypothetical protein